MKFIYCSSEPAERRVHVNSQKTTGACSVCCKPSRLRRCSAGGAPTNILRKVAISRRRSAYCVCVFRSIVSRSRLNTTQARDIKLLPPLFCRMRDDPAHLVMQHYLKKTGVDWRGSVEPKLKLALNEHHGYTYVCKKDPRHEDEWKQRKVDDHGPMR